MLLRRFRLIWNHISRWQCRTYSLSHGWRTGERRASEKLPSTPARTRFAPSPTGYLHLGSLRTALFNYLLARATGGQFLLRVEDTDRKRTIADAEQRLYKDLRWSGLEWDEGPDVGGPYGPYKQSERTNLYQKHAETLLQSGHAYRCFCSSEKLNELALRRASLGLPSDYDRTCEGIPAHRSDESASRGEAFVVRLRVPAQPPEYVDLIYGPVGRPSHKRKARNLGEALYEDPILLKSDGLPTYHLANVVDDHSMKITHVIRAAEWMSSTPKHLTLYKALGWQAPEFAHVGLLQDSSHQKFSKRKGDLSIRRFDEQGIFPEALLNYVALYGWSHTQMNDVMSLEDLVKAFDLKFTKGNTVVEPHKLMYLQKKYAVRYTQQNDPQLETLVNTIFKTIQQEFQNPSWYPDKVYQSHLEGQALKDRIAEVLRHTAKNYTTIEDFFNKYDYFFYETSLPNQDDLSPMNATYEKFSSQLYTVNAKFRSVSPEKWCEDLLRETITVIADNLCSELNQPFKETYKIVQFYLRWAISKGRSGPSMPTTMALLGRDTSLQRFDELAAALRSRSQAASESNPNRA
ncbi:MAG: hypothetical protein Q9170_002505 [Blastenia crenularia]